jgi:hypothetical protein
MQDFITLGTAPVEEPCAHVGQPDYDGKVRGECRRFINLLRLGASGEWVVDHIAGRR